VHAEGITPDPKRRDGLASKCFSVCLANVKIFKCWGLGGCSARLSRRRNRVRQGNGASG